MSQLLESCRDQIVSYHEHESLLDHKQEEELTEAERKDAWAEYEAEKEVFKSCIVIITTLQDKVSNTLFKYVFSFS